MVGGEGDVADPVVRVAARDYPRPGSRTEPISGSQSLRLERASGSHSTRLGSRSLRRARERAAPARDRGDAVVTSLVQIAAAYLVRAVLAIEGGGPGSAVLSGGSGSVRLCALLLRPGGNQHACVIRSKKF